MMLLQYGKENYKEDGEIEIGPGQSIWFFRDNAINSYNQILDGNLIIYYSSNNDEKISGEDGYNCPGLVVSEYIYKSSISDNRAPNNSTYGIYEMARRANSYDTKLACTMQNYNTFESNDVEEDQKKYGIKGTKTIATYSPKPIQVGVSNYIPKISIELNIEGNFNGFAEYSRKDSLKKWRNGNLPNNKALAVSIPSYARTTKGEKGEFDDTDKANAYEYDIVPLSNSSYRNPFGYYGSYKDILLNNHPTSTNGWSNWNVPTVIEYKIKNTSSSDKDYIIYAENSMYFGEKFAERIEKGGSATFIYRRNVTTDYNDNNNGTWSFSQCYTDDVNSKKCGKGTSDNPKYELNENGSEGVATIAAMGTIKAGTEKKVNFVSYLVNQCSATMYYKVRIAPNTTEANDALEALK